MIQKYTQTTYETCLACCLLQLVNNVKPIKITKKLELDCIVHSLKFSKNDFVIGHLDFIVKKFKVNILRIVDNIYFYNYIKKIKHSKNINTIVQTIDLNLINNLLKKNYPIIYIDAYYLFKIHHYPHFVTVLKKNKNNYKIFDTWDGKIKLINRITFLESIISLRNRLRFTPQILTIT